MDDNKWDISSLTEDYNNITTVLSKYKNKLDIHIYFQTNIQYAGIFFKYNLYV